MIVSQLQYIISGGSGLWMESQRIVKSCIFETVTGCGKGNEFWKEFKNITDSDEPFCI